MFKLYLGAGLVLAILLSCAGLMAGYQSALNAAFARGHAAGIAQISIQIQQQLDAVQNASAALVADANQKVTSLEQNRAQLQTRLDAVNMAGRKASAQHRACLDSGLMRALNRIGANSTASGGGP